MQRIADMSAKLFNRLADVGRMNRTVAQFAPIDVLPLGDQCQHRIILSSSAIFQRRHVDIQNGKDQVAAAELRFTREECFKLEPAIRAGDYSGSDDRNKKS